MTQTDFKNQVDNLMNILWGAGVASHATIIEQINYLVFLRSLSRKDDNAIKLDPAAERIFSGELKKYHWDNLLIHNAEELFTTLEEIFRKLPELTTDSTIKLLFRDAHVKVFDKPTLRRLVHEIEKMFSDLEKQSTSGHTDIFGDMYEYLLSKLSQAGTLGSFRTPRHIIKFMVDVIDPKKGETILDPACGTAGFLVAALKHLEEKYTSEDYKKLDKYPMDLLSSPEREFVYRHTFTGFDSDFDMFKFGLMNLYLHKLEHPNIKRQNTLVDTAGDRTKWDVILANPPFSGALDINSVSEDLRMGTSATEILFLRYMLDHLNTNGRIGVIVPDGIISTENGQAFTKIRHLLVERGLWGVISLPAGVFEPYSKSKTWVLLVDKVFAKKVHEIVFVEIENDGFELNPSRKPIQGSQLTEGLQILKLWKDNYQKDKSKISCWINKSEILENQGCSLAPKRYLLDQNKKGCIRIGDLIELSSGERVGERNNVPIMSITMERGLVDQSDKFKKRIASNNISKYKLVKRNELVVGFPIDEGVLGFQTKYEYAAVSPAYDVWKLKTKCNVEILELILRSKQARETYKRFIRGTANRRRVVPKDVFVEITIPDPKSPIVSGVPSLLSDKLQLENDLMKNKTKIEETIEEVWGK